MSAIASRASTAVRYELFSLPWLLSRIYFDELLLGFWAGRLSAYALSEDKDAEIRGILTELTARHAAAVQNFEGRHGEVPRQTLGTVDTRFFSRQSGAPA